MRYAMFSANLLKGGMFRGVLVTVEGIFEKVPKPKNFWVLLKKHPSPKTLMRYAVFSADLLKGGMFWGVLVTVEGIFEKVPKPKNFNALRGV